MSRRTIFTLLAVLAIGAMALSSCGDDDDAADDTTSTAASDDAATDDGSSDVENACPADGCTVSIASAEADESGEITVEFDANFAPDFSANHIHIYWDTYNADEVSGDAADRGVTQGAWVATDEYPTYVTEADVSVANSGDSTTLCVTTGDGDHNVLDATEFACLDVSDAL
jgi:hypothetical protein